MANHLQNLKAFAADLIESGEEFPQTLTNEETLTIRGRSVDVFYDEHRAGWEAFCAGVASVAGCCRDEVIDGMADRIDRDEWAEAAAQGIARGGDIDDRHPTFESIWQNAPAHHPYRLLFASSQELQDHARRLAKRERAELVGLATAMGFLIVE
jgi:hypothetical protein